MPYDGRPHIHIGFQNILTIMAIARHESFTTFEGKMYRVPPFQKDKLLRRTDRAVFCKQQDCKDCTRDPYGKSTYHADCFMLFNQFCLSEDKFCRLFMAAKRTSAVDGVEHLDELYDPVASQQLNIVFELLGLPRLPLTVCRSIWSLLGPTSTHIAARFCTVLQLAAELNSAPLVPSNCPLSEVRLFKRGQYIRVNKTMGAERPYVRVIEDSRGIKRIERVMTRKESKSKTEVSTYMGERLFSLMTIDFRVSKTQLIHLII
ncbi:hypothetical protein BBK36DRAFT_1107188 [Trichoderma citrinoviride]|uniref:Uncharacterized protein n=1 Tax=Trichoderma citrinoviride TaxID=58853 RepID=A0A2T4BN68_9HYPO|nr:hypothetical protein BBK36DRAFT_1107188 [Trichoderma citrinoviride]PTB70709.1 hypothetical protein BBK36DRAFT_1107188 [Trichoderma citrinoviride]